MKAIILLASLLLTTAPALAADPHAGLPPEASETTGLVEVTPRYVLMDTSGRAILDDYFAGRFQLISFGYTSCPSVCPSTLAAMSLILGKLGALAGQVQPIFISVDPERDKPDVLERYTQNFDPRIMGLTGSPELIAGVARNFKVTYAKHLEPGAPPAEYSMDHSVGMYLIGPDGRFLTKYGYSASAADIAERLKQRIEAYNAEKAAEKLAAEKQPK
ncbi:MAG: SCO family protein [Rhodocyclaceae bacterium]|nr:SCO family protein [Rhodocyclaceae bacterium]